jgi:hypothetical protein
MTFTPPISLVCISARKRTLLVLGRMSGRIRPRLRASCLIAQRDEQRGNVLAVLTSLGKRRTRADAPDAVG